MGMILKNRAPVPVYRSKQACPVWWQCNFPHHETPNWVVIEPIEDSARVISSMLDIVMIRTFGHDIVERFASYSKKFLWLML